MAVVVDVFGAHWSDDGVAAAGGEGAGRAWGGFLLVLVAEHGCLVFGRDEEIAHLGGRCTWRTHEAACVCC
jgi:hypothetical protein